MLAGEFTIWLLPCGPSRLAPATLGELRDAALASEDGQKLRFALQRLSLA